MLAGPQKLKATDNSDVKMATMCAFPPTLFSICVCSCCPFPCHYRNDLEIRFLCFTFSKALYHYGGSYWMWQASTKVNDG